MKKDTTKTTEKQLTVKKTLSLQDMVDFETSNRKILTDFISQHMIKGIDFGSIQIGGRNSKDCLFKSGAEKIGSLFRLRADVIKDSDTWEMSGSKFGLFCYRCNLYNNKGEIVGMGLGACSVEEKKNFNNAIKIAKKRAFVDAILTTGALSDFFIQDLEDMENTSHSQRRVGGEEVSADMGVEPHEEQDTSSPRVDYACDDCGKGISRTVADYSRREFGKTLCFPDCQAKARREQRA